MFHVKQWDIAQVRLLILKAERQCGSVQIGAFLKCIRTEGHLTTWSGVSKLPFPRKHVTIPQYGHQVSRGSVRDTDNERIPRQSSGWGSWLLPGLDRILNEGLVLTRSILDSPPRANARLLPAASSRNVSRETVSEMLEVAGLITSDAKATNCLRMAGKPT